ncbi:MAG: hypothetical protein ACOX2F_01115 [bacterium]
MLLLLMICSGFLAGAEGTVLESVASHLKGFKITAEILEEKYSCMSLDQLLEQSLAEINDLEKAVVSARKNTRLAGLLPEITAWGKYKSDEKLYLYQKNNIAVGKDYITIGPDDNNTTYGDLNSFEVGGRIRFDLTKLLYNSDMIRFSDQQQKLYFLKIEMVEKLSSVYFFTAMLKAVKELGVEVPPEKMIVYEVIDKKQNGWLKSLTGIDLYLCGEKE